MMSIIARIWKFFTGIGFVCFLALLLRLPLLSSSLWLDEAAQALESSRPLSAQLYIREDYQPPLYHLLVHGLIQVSTAEWWMRVASLVPGILTIVVLYAILGRVASKRTAFIGSMLLATSPMHIFYSQELRPYALAVFFVTCSWYFLIPATHGERKTDQRLWAGYFFSTLLGLYTMYVYPFFFAAQILYVFCERATFRKHILIAILLACIGFSPWVPSFLGQLKSGTVLQTSLPGWSSAVATPQLKALPLTYGKFLIGQVPFAGNALLMIGVASFLLALFLLFFRSWRQGKYRFFVYWGVVPVLLAWGISFFVPVIAPKRVLAALPALLSLAALYRSGLFRYFWICIICLQVFCLVLYWRSPLMQRENWRGVLQVIQKQSTESSIVAFSFPDVFAPWAWYAPKESATVTTKQISVPKDWDDTEFSNSIRKYKKVFVFDYLRDLTDPYKRLEYVLKKEGFDQKELLDGYGIGFVRVFARMSSE